MRVRADQQNGTCNKHGYARLHSDLLSAHSSYGVVLAPASKLRHEGTKNTNLTQSSQNAQRTEFASVVDLRAVLPPQSADEVGRPTIDDDFHLSHAFGSHDQRRAALLRTKGQH